MNNLWIQLELRLIEGLRGLVDLGRGAKLGLTLATDASLCVIAVWIAFSLRLGEWDLWTSSVRTVILVSLAIWPPIFVFSGVYRSVVRFSGSSTMVRIASSCVILAVMLSLFFVVNQVEGIPRTIAVIQPMVFATLLMISRLVTRYVLYDLLNRRGYSGRANRVLIYGAGSAGRQLALSLRHEPGMILFGYVDDNERLKGQHLDSAVVYHSAALNDLVEDHRVDTVLLAMPRISRKRREEIIRRFAGLSVKVLTTPALSDLVDGRVTISDLHEIKITDLLGRDPVPPDPALLHGAIENRTLLVTGAGGSIGSELCRQIALCKPSVIVLVEMTELALYLIQSELREMQDAGKIDPRTQIIAELGNVADESTARRLFARWRPQTVFHAAAYKHVPLVEENVIAGMRNNVFGTLCCALAARSVKAERFILVSTDKAVRPTNIMGASKRICELVLQALAADQAETRFAMVRFGNVLGSSGSVVPRFQQQIRDGGPVTLTHRDVTRYFMTIPEAAQLVIQAGAMAEGGEVFVLDMGEPVRIYDMARAMIQLSGRTVRDDTNPGGDIEIREVGLRKGEKLYEELLIGNSPMPTSHPRIMRAMENRLSWQELSDVLDRLKLALSEGDQTTTRGILKSLVPEYHDGLSTKAA